MGKVARKTLATLGLAALVTTAAWWVRRDNTRLAAKALLAAQQKKLFACPVPTHVVEIRLENANELLVLQRRANADETDAHKSGDAEGSWQIHAWPSAAAKAASQPATLRAPADASTTAALLQATCALEEVGSAIEPKDDAATFAARFGLAPPPRHTLTLRDVTGKEQVLRAGNKSTFDDSLYVRMNEEGAVRRVDAAFLFQLERDALSLREKRLVQRNSPQVQRLVVRPTNAPAYRLVRRPPPAADGNDAPPYTPGWQLEPLAASQPTQAADTMQAESLVAAVCQLRAKQFMVETADPAARTRFGLNQPHLEVCLEDDAGQATRLHFGRLTLGQEHHDFAQAGNTDAAIVQLPSSWTVDKLTAGAQELRDMHVLQLAAEEVARVVLQDHNQRTLTFVRKQDPKLPPSRQGFELAPTGAAASSAPAPPAVDGQRVAALVARLAELRADSWDEAAQKHLAKDAPQAQAALAARGLSPAQRTVAFYGQDGALLAELRLGYTHAERTWVLGNKTSFAAQVFANAVTEVVADANAFLSQAARPEPEQRR